MGDKKNKYAIEENDRYGHDRRWLVGKPLAKYKEHVRDVQDCTSEAGGSYVIKGAHNSNGKGIKRFRAEIRGMKSLTERGVSGVLPVIDSQSNHSNVWYVMPKVISLADHLRNGSFDDVVRAFAVLADTLARLSEGPNAVAHRDIKPDNLFWYNDGPVLADFGIAAWSDSTGRLTTEGNKIGPMYFLAPEARYTYGDVDWRRADVYSLAMTFWSIAAPRRVSKKGRKTVAVPPPGPISQTHEQFSMFKFGDSDAARLDVLMEQATNYYPDRRPTAVEFRDELLTWLEMFPGSHRPPQATDTHRGFKSLVRTFRRFEIHQGAFLEAVQRECGLMVGRVDWDETVSISYQPRGEVDADGQPRHTAIMAAHNISDEEWDGSLVLALRHRDGLKRLVVGGLVDVQGTVHLIVEYQERVEGKWTLEFDNNVPSLLIGRLTTDKHIRDNIADALKASTTFIDGAAPHLQWTGERVL